MSSDVATGAHREDDPPDVRVATQIGDPAAEHARRSAETRDALSAGQADHVDANCLLISPPDRKPVLAVEPAKPRFTCRLELELAVRRAAGRVDDANPI